MTETRGRRIYHLVAAQEWQREAGHSGPVARDQLERHGFVHCCTREQILEVASWWLTAEAPLIAIEIDAGRAGDVRFERADLGREYPHVYNAVPREAVVATHEVTSAAGGALALPARLADPPPGFTVEGIAGGRPVRVRWCDRRFDADNTGVLGRLNEAVAKGVPVPQFPGVERAASAATPYDAFCVVAAALDEVTRYLGDGFEADDAGGGR